ncbi:MAG: sporulation membrane protein YtaF [Tissierellia bacterium]|nr:sporulation membrane protein YtaF [Tissierellia bacterium]
MNILSSLLFAISANTDNFVVGLSYGIKKIRIARVSNLIIALISLVGTILSMSLSKVILNYIPEFLASLIGSSILILLGVLTIAKPLLKRDSDSILDNPEKADKDKSLNIDAKESIALGLALTINNVGLGIGASFAGLNITITALFTFVLSLLAIVVGFSLGSYYLSELFGKSATIISGLLIIALGLFEILI